MLFKNKQSKEKLRTTLTLMYDGQTFRYEQWPGEIPPIGANIGPPEGGFFNVTGANYYYDESGYHQHVILYLRNLNAELGKTPPKPHATACWCMDCQYPGV